MVSNDGEIKGMRNTNCVDIHAALGEHPFQSSLMPSADQ